MLPWADDILIVDDVKQTLNLAIDGLFLYCEAASIFIEVKAVDVAWGSTRTTKMVPE
jgi:hypothetical protein